MREPDALRLRSDPKCFAIPVEAESPDRLNQFQTGLRITKEDHLSWAVGASVDHV